MSLTKTKPFKILIGLALLVSAFALQQYSFRATAWVLFLPLVVSYIHFFRTSKTKWMRLIFVLFVIAVFLPIDVSLRNFPGPPRFVPLIMGAPSEEDSAREERGEVLLGGCILRGNAPRWVLVW